MHLFFNLKIITLNKILLLQDDIYFHKKIPSNFKNIQMFVMNPFPVYELSFVDNMKKFSSLVRPKNEIRRKEYFDFIQKKIKSVGKNKERTFKNWP